MRVVFCAAASVLCISLGSLSSAQDAGLFLELPSDQANQDELELNEAEPPERSDSQLFIGSEFEGKSFYSEQPESSPVFEHTIGRWKDPFTLPHSRMECVKWASGDWPWGGGWKTCIGHAYQWQWMYVTAFLRVYTKTPQEIASEVQGCLATGAVAGVLAGAMDAFLTGGVTAFESAKVTAVSVVTVCLTEKIGDNLVTVNIDTNSKWGDWE